MPKYPAKPEASAPTTNESEIKALESALPLLATPRRMAMAKTKMAKTRYSVFKKAMAPSAILAPIDFIRSVPSSWASIQLVFQKEYIMAKTPAPITNIKLELIGSRTPQIKH